MKMRIRTFVLAACSIILLCAAASAGCSSPTRSAKSAAETLLTYEKYNQWEQAWEMLHPDSQAIWTNKTAFISELDHPLSNLKSFEIGKAKTVSSWTSQSTNRTYSDVVEITVTLIYSTASGEVERSDMIHAVKISDSWKFFQHLKK